MRRHVLGGLAVVALVVGPSLGMAGPEPTGPVVGLPAPAFALTPLRFYDFRLDEGEISRANAWELYEPVRLGDFRNKWPVALVFGSAASVRHTDVLALEALHRRYGDRVRFLFVYIHGGSSEESHAAPRAPQPDLERARIANSFVSETGLSIPCVVDGRDAAAMKAYAAQPARLYVVDKAGAIAFVSDPANARLDLGAFEAALVSVNESSP